MIKRNLGLFGFKTINMLLIHDKIGTCFILAIQCTLYSIESSSIGFTFLKENLSIIAWILSPYGDILHQMDNSEVCENIKSKF